jgi:hypothetical protein
MLSSKFFYVFLFSVALFIITGIAALYLKKIDEKIFKPGKLKKRHRKYF